MKILIAEDDALFRRTLEELLLPAYELQVAAHGDEAWALLQRPDPPKLAILDWVMPSFSGPQLCRKIRSSAETSATYIILLTSRNTVADIISRPSTTLTVISSGMKCSSKSPADYFAQLASMTGLDDTVARNS